MFRFGKGIQYKKRERLPKIPAMAYCESTFMRATQSFIPALMLQGTFPDGCGRGTLHPWGAR